MFIQTEDTPNPETMKFLPGMPLIEKGTVEVKSIEEAERYAPLASRLFAAGSIQQVFIARDFVSVTTTQDGDWDILRPLLITALMQHLTFGEPIVHDSYFDQKQNNAGDTDVPQINKEIMALLEERVRPAVAQDGGDIEFDRFEDGVLYLHMRGACAGCPSSTLTLKAGIENMMKHYIPEVQEVRAVEL